MHHACIILKLEASLSRTNEFMYPAWKVEIPKESSTAPECVSTVSIVASLDIIRRRLSPPFLEALETEVYP